MTDPIEDRLRDVLTRVVPEPPARLVLSPTPARRRRRRATAVGAALLVAAAVAVPVVLTRDGSSDRRVEPAPAPAPYDAPPCDTAAPAAPTTVPDPTSVVSVRLCPLDEHTAAPADALVSGFEELTGAAASPGGTRTCTGSDPEHTVLDFRLADGRRVPVVLVECSGSSPGTVLRTFLDLLDRQRDNLIDDGRSGPPPTCGTPTTRAPVDPTRDHLVAAVACPGDRPLDEVRLAVLRGGWETATHVPPEVGMADSCSMAGRRLQWIVATTSRGDAAMLNEFCDVLRLPGWRDSGDAWTIATLLGIDDLA